MAKSRSVGNSERVRDFTFTLSLFPTADSPTINFKPLNLR
ncbi:hypothetical protein RintRC_2375 [Richelia intracellularis]|nr:hypothetical protein RintRC_2375 [Richelia intracellularis]